MTATDDMVDRLQDIIDSNSRAGSEAYFAWIESTISKTDWAAFEKALELGDWGRAADLIQWERLDLDPLLRDTLEKAAEANSDYISRIMRADNFRYDLKDPNALKWITDHGAELVSQIDEPTQKAIQEVVYRGYFSGYTPRDQAKIIKDLIGLTPGETERLEKMAADLAKDGLSQADISRIIGEEADASRKRRAAVIAVNETSEAANRGQYFSTADACARGVIDPAKYEGYRIVTPDDLLCDTCAAHAGEARPLPGGVYPSTGSTIAKVHTSCRCCEGYRLISKKEGVPLMTSTSEYKLTTTAVQFEAARIRKTETSIFVPTVPIVEGVFWGHGFPVLRRADKFGPEANWLEGIPILINHQPLDPDARRVGQLRSPKFDPEGRRVAAITEFYRRHLTPEESEAIESGGALNGSLFFACYLKFEEGVWTNPKTGEQVPYEAVEEPHYVFFEYSMVKQGVVTPEDGAGFNIESGPVTLAIAAESIRSRNGNGTGGSSMVETNPKVTNAGGEKEGTVVETSEAQKPSPAPAAKPTLEERFEALETSILEEREARKLAEFRECLKPGCETEAEELYELSRTDPVTFAREHAHKLLGKRREHAPARGVPVVEGAAGGFNLATEQDKLWGRSF